MATILEKTLVPDGWEVLVRLKDGREFTWHYLAEPTQKMVDNTEIALKIAELSNVNAD